VVRDGHCVLARSPPTTIGDGKHAAEQFVREHPLVLEEGEMARILEPDKLALRSRDRLSVLLDQCGMAIWIVSYRPSPSDLAVRVTTGPRGRWQTAVMKVLKATLKMCLMR
jgi:hypothetical protein